MLGSGEHGHARARVRHDRPKGHARVLWALPTTASEAEFHRCHGHEALEQLFDQAAIVPTDPLRASVV
ncbi:suppressor of fused domain protein [Streptomyces sp. HUAS TT20]|nr:suppressor of fused domain protein [Streptomyces sp. HUAS 15-9]